MRARIELVTLLVEDLPASLRFYRDALDFEVTRERGDYVELGGEGFRLALYPRRQLARQLDVAAIGERARGHAMVLSLPVRSPAEVDRLFARVTLAGGRSVRPPARMPWGPHAAFLLDPDGNLLELVSHEHTSDKPG